MRFLQVFVIYYDLDFMIVLVWDSHMKREQNVNSNAGRQINVIIQFLPIFEPFQPGASAKTLQLEG